MKYLLIAIAFMVFPAALLCEENPEPAATSDTDRARDTVITSDSLSYDAEQRVASFDGNVVVSDPEMSIKADRMTVVFTEDNTVNSIEADGNVVISQEDTMGSSGHAVYYVQEGRIVLSISPRVRRQNDELSGETITYYRDTGRMVCEPNAVLRVHAMTQITDVGPLGK